jgi:hypothetical protein
VSWRDVVFAPWSEEESFPTFERVVEQSGNGTIRINFDPPGAGLPLGERVLKNHFGPRKAQQ